MTGGLNFTFAPPSRLVTSFFILGSFFYFVGALLFFNIDFLNVYYLEPKAVGFMHIFLVGFMISVIFGAMYQLISVVLEIPLYSNDLAYTHLVLFGVGAIAFFSAFANDGIFEYLGYGSTILYISFLLYIINVLLSIKNVKKFEIKAFFVTAAHIILFIGVTYGLLSSLGLVHSNLNFDTINLAHSHIILVLFGFAGGLIMIIATVLLPMFMLSHNFNKKITNYAFVGVILSSLFAIFEWYLLAKVVMMATIFIFSYQLYDIYKKRIRKLTDIYSINMMTSMGFMIASALLIPFLSNEIVLKLFMIFLVFGVISSFVVGHIYKIVPFLVWNEKFAPLVGKQKIPMLADMVHEKGSYFEYKAKMATILFLTFGIFFGSSIIITLGKLAFLVNALAVVANVIYIFRYKG